MTGVKLLGPDGRELPPARPRRSASLAGPNGAGYFGYEAPYTAASIYDEHVAAWRPYLWSPDAKLNMFRDRIVARVRDLVRNDGWASGGVTRILDSVIGGTFRPKSKPDYRTLARLSGNDKFDATWAHEFGKAVESHYRTWANDEGRYCDASRNLSIPAMNRLAFRTLIVDGDALAVMTWLPDRVKPGCAKYATCVQLIDPDRLSNPQLVFDQQTMRGGVKVDEIGAAVGYYIREAHQGDWWAAAKSMKWQLIPRETTWGRPVTIHHYESDQPGQHRGGAGILTPVLARMKMLARYDTNELDASIVNAIFGAYIESPFDQSVLAESLGEEVRLSGYQDERSEFHKDRRTMLSGVGMQILFPGEKINTVNANRPNGNFREFQGAVLRNVASALGLSAQQLSNDWSDVNYSSARGALLEVWKTFTRRRHDFAAGFSHMLFVAWLEESFEIDDLPMPAGDKPEFLEARQAYAATKWLGPGRGWVDPLDEKRAAVLGMEAGLSTLEAEVAEASGDDWEDILDQLQNEKDGFLKRGLTPPTSATISTAPEAKPPNATDKGPKRDNEARP